MYDLRGKVALVTGAARMKGIGQAIAFRLACDGADIVVNGRYRSPESYPEWEQRAGWRGLDSLVENIEKLGRQALAVTADISQKKEVEEMVTRALDRFGHIDILVNNAALHGVKDNCPLTDLSEDIWNRYLSVNLTGTFLVSQAVARHMKECGAGGRIVNISSNSAKRPTLERVHYCTSKAGMIMLTQVTALELAPYRINVNVICPGPILTWEPEHQGKLIFQQIEQGLTEEQAVARVYETPVYRQYLERIPQGRLGSVYEIANMIAFLASGESDFITGQVLGVDGGEFIRS